MQLFIEDREDDYQVEFSIQGEKMKDEDLIANHAQNGKNLVLEGRLICLSPLIPLKSSPLVIGISGPTTAGKSTIGKLLSL